ncbi:MAG: hypothetical protein DRI24_16185 [Deltaproteobacteria bacterium]|nr:MAG: hypothetical protein DRI24_16185 [Deltaproteobacteria bacterium]
MKPTNVRHILINQTLLMITILLLICILAACEGSKDISDSTSTRDTGSIAFNVAWNQDLDSDTDYQVRAAVCGNLPNEVKTVRVAIVNGTSVVKRGGPWNCDAYSGTIKDVPIGSDYTLLFYGHNENDRTTYSGASIGISVNTGMNDIGIINANQFFSEIISPPDTSSNIDPDNAEFNWLSSTGAAAYQLWISESADLSDPLIFYADDISFTVPPGLLYADTTYYWTVFPIDIYDNRSYFYGDNYSYTTASGGGGALDVNLTSYTYDWGDPDLDVYFRISNNTLNWGDSLGVRFAVINDGSKDIPSDTGIWVSLYLSTNNYISEADYELEYRVLSYGLQGGWYVYQQPGNEWQITLPGSAPPGFPASGDFYIGLIIDPDDDVIETNEFDNLNMGETEDYVPVNISP